MFSYRRARWAVLLGVLLAMAGPMSARAQDGVLHEVSENMKLSRGQFTRRLATAALVGKVKAGTPWCPAALGASQCDITAVGSDSVDLATGIGPVKARFAVVVQGDNPADGPEWVVLRGTLRGTIDLSPAVLGKDGVPGTYDELPYGTMLGEWSVRGEKDGPLAGYADRGRLSGVFRLPFTMGDYPPMYMTEAGLVPVGDGDRSLSVPTVRLEITFLP